MLRDLIVLGVSSTAGSRTRAKRYRLFNEIPALRERDILGDLEYEAVIVDHLMKPSGNRPGFDEFRARSLAVTIMGIARSALTTWAHDPIVRSDGRRGAGPRRTHVSFARDGAVVIRGALSPSQVALAAAGIEAVLADPSPLALTASSPDDPGRFVEDFRNWQRIDAISELALDPALGALAAELMGSATARFFHDHVLVKEPGTRQRTPWHQDLPYFNVAGTQNVSFWIPVDPVPIDGSLEFVGGSHLGPWCTPRTFMDQVARWFPDGQLAELPDIEADRSAFPILTWDLEPGDLVAFHMLTIHGAPGFVGPGRRRVLSLRYLGDDMVHAPRPWRTSPPFPELDGFPAGVALDHPLFPLVHRT